MTPTHKVQRQVKLIHDIRRQDIGFPSFRMEKELVKGITTKREEGASCFGNILFLLYLDAGYMSSLL